MPYAWCSTSPVIFCLIKYSLLFFYPITNVCWKFYHMADSLTLYLIPLKIYPWLSVPTTLTILLSCFQTAQSNCKPSFSSMDPAPAPLHFDPFWSNLIGLTPVRFTEKLWHYYLNMGFARSSGFGSLRLYTFSRNQLMDLDTVPEH